MMIWVLLLQNVENILSLAREKDVHVIHVREKDQSPDISTWLPWVSS